MLCCAGRHLRLRHLRLRRLRGRPPAHYCCGRCGRPMLCASAATLTGCSGEAAKCRPGAGSLGAAWAAHARFDRTMSRAAHTRCALSSTRRSSCDPRRKFDNSGARCAVGARRATAGRQPSVIARTNARFTRLVRGIARCFAASISSIGPIPEINAGRPASAIAAFFYGPSKRRANERPAGRACRRTQCEDRHIAIFRRQDELKIKVNIK